MEIKTLAHGKAIKISTITPHFGEEPPLSGTGGAGAVFFSHCNLRCVYCQNIDISHFRINEKLISPEELADKFFQLQDRDCHNIDLVSPSHQLAGIIPALKIAKSQGLKIPILYNSNGFEPMKFLKELDGLVDIYLPDIKYDSDKIAQDLSGIRNYVSISHANLKEMYRQVGLLELNENEIAMKGMLVRHLVLPNRIAGSFGVLEFLATELSHDLSLSIMAQYNPYYFNEKQVNTNETLKFYPEISRKITKAEYNEVVDWALGFGFENLWLQDPEESQEHGAPDFNQPQPFKWDGHDEILPVLASRLEKNPVF